MAERCVAILGPGLLGGSLALACQDFYSGTELRIWARRAEALDRLSLHGVTARLCPTVGECVEGASMIVLATPVGSMESLAREIAAASLAPDAIITDVGSVKTPLVQRLTPLFPKSAGPVFIGSHPMAGSEKAGIEASRGSLFKKAVCVITPTDSTPADALARVEAFWQGIGARVICMPAEEHDRHVARISHLPHLMAAVTTLSALKNDPASAACIGSGFRDSTRVAAGDPNLWTGIVQQNRGPILSSLRDATANLTRLVEIIETLDDDTLRQFLDDAKQLRDSVPPHLPDHGHTQS